MRAPPVLPPVPAVAPAAGSHGPDPAPPGRRGASRDQRRRPPPGAAPEILPPGPPAPPYMPGHGLYVMGRARRP